MNPPRESSPRPVRGGDDIPVMRLSYRLIFFLLLTAAAEIGFVWWLFTVFQ